MRYLLRISAGLLLWAVSFSLLYALQGMSCAMGWDRITLPMGNLSRWVLTIIWLILLTFSAWLIHRAMGATKGLERKLALSSAITGFVAILITGSPVLITSTCAA